MISCMTSFFWLESETAFAGGVFFHMNLLARHRSGYGLDRLGMCFWSPCDHTCSWFGPYLKKLMKRLKLFGLKKTTENPVP